jgi:hypothetical protein
MDEILTDGGEIRGENLIQKFNDTLFGFHTSLLRSRERFVACLAYMFS